MSLPIPNTITVVNTYPQLTGTYTLIPGVTAPTDPDYISRTNMWIKTPALSGTIVYTLPGQQLWPESCACPLICRGFTEDVVLLLLSGDQGLFYGNAYNASLGDWDPLFNPLDTRFDDTVCAYFWGPEEQTIFGVCSTLSNFIPVMVGDWRGTWPSRPEFLRITGGIG